MPTNATYNRGRTEPVDVPLLLVGGEHLFGPIFPRIADSLRANYGWSDVRAEIISGAGHYLVEERPDVVVDLVERHVGGRRR